MPILPAAIGAVAGLFGQERANKINQREAQKNREFSAAEAQKARDFSERMSNTEWQRALADMRAAGINPALAYSQGGASAPTGSAASGTATAPAGDSASSAMQAAAQAKTLQIMDEQHKKAKGEATSARAKGTLDSARAAYLTNVFSANGYTKPPLIHDLLDYEIESARNGASNMRALSERNSALARIAAPMADLSGEMGMLLPILGGATTLASPGSRLLSSFITRSRRLGRKGKR
ncbi:putative minor capsid protein [Eel River basin pequenovirus]|nr:putative minor capsid protein [Eel River basin pequenovirus]